MEHMQLYKEEETPYQVGLDASLEQECDVPCSQLTKANFLGILKGLEKGRVLEVRTLEDNVETTEGIEVIFAGDGQHRTYALVIPNDNIPGTWTGQLQCWHRHTDSVGFVLNGNLVYLGNEHEASLYAKRDLSQINDAVRAVADKRIQDEVNAYELSRHIQPNDLEDL